jgi:hypothetical protein
MTPHEWGKLQGFINYAFIDENGRTMVPLRFVSEFFGAIVEWDAETQRIEVIL